MTTKLLIPESVEPELDLPPDVVVQRFDPSAPLPSDASDAAGLIAWALPRGWLQTAARELPRLRWAQSLGAGAEDVLNAGFGEQVVLTSGVGLHDEPVAEHALALLLAAARRLDLFLDAQREHRWSDRGGPQPGDRAPEFSTLRGRRLVIWGFGGIGQTIARYATTFGASVTGVARTAGERAGFPVIANDDIDSVLPDADAVVITLPGGAETRHALDARRIALLKRTCWVVNVGRGSCIDEAALVAALTEERLGGAALDVFDTEPLPAESELWDAPNVILTPHAAGGRPLHAAELIAHNARALVGEAEWRNRISR